MNKTRILFLGPPGAGKGTQAEMLCSARNLAHLSTGDLLRAEVSSKTELGRKAEEVMKRGELVSDDLVLAIVQARLGKAKDGWLLDGFPRNLHQSAALESFLGNIHQELQVVVLLELDDESLVSRLLARGRDDDKEPVIRHRLEVYRDKTAPLVQHYREMGLLKVVEADGSVNEIAERIVKELE